MIIRIFVEVIVTDLYLANTIGCVYCDRVLYFNVNNQDSKTTCIMIILSNFLCLFLNRLRKFYLKCMYQISQKYFLTFYGDAMYSVDVAIMFMNVDNVSRTHLSFEFISQPLTASAYEGR